MKKMASSSDPYWSVSEFCGSVQCIVQNHGGLPIKHLCFSSDCKATTRQMCKKCIPLHHKHHVISIDYFDELNSEEVLADEVLNGRIDQIVARVKALRVEIDESFDTLVAQIQQNRSLSLKAILDPFLTKSVEPSTVNAIRQAILDSVQWSDEGVIKMKSHWEGIAQRMGQYRQDLCKRILETFDLSTLKEQPTTMRATIQQLAKFKRKIENEKDTQLAVEEMNKLGNLDSMDLEMSWGSKQITDNEVFKLIKPIQMNKNLKHFKLNLFLSQEVTDASITQLAQALSGLTQLETLEIDLSKTKVTDTSITQLALALSRFTHLQKFEFCLHQTQVTDNSVIEIAKALSRLTNLHQFKFNISDTKVTDTSVIQIAQTLSRFANLKKFYLGLQSTQVTDDSAFQIAQTFNEFTHLQTFLLNLACTKVTDNSVIYIANTLRGCSGLQSFELLLSRTQVTDSSVIEIAQTLSGFTCLEQLDLALYNTKVNDSSMIQLAKALHGLTFLQCFTLNLNETQVTDSSTIQIALALRTNKLLNHVKLRLESTNVTDKSVIEISKTVAQLQLNCLFIQLEKTKVSDKFRKNYESSKKLVKHTK